MKPLSVEDGTVCEFCGTHCYQGAEHNARVEDNARFDDPKPAAVPVEERTQDNAQNLRYATQIAEYLHKNCYSEVTQWKPISGDLFGVLIQIDNMCTGVQRKPIPEERTAEMEELMASLRAAAQRAMPGTWGYTEDKDGTDKEFRVKRRLFKVGETFGQRKGIAFVFGDCDANASHISLASPENILKLLDHIEDTAE